MFPILFSLSRRQWSLYYGSNKFAIFVSKTKPGVSYKALSDLNSWLHELEPCYLASVRSLSFVHLNASIVLDIDFDVRAQRFGIVRRSTLSLPARKEDLHYTFDSMWHANVPQFIASVMQDVRWAEDLHISYPYTKSSLFLLTTFKSCVLERVRQAYSVTIDESTMSWYRC